ncbi:hypothetical protein H4R18_005524 [Coemansia javaensis]|uniref:F-box domain-containing protein n=1 Tax=Coemansia javaensis TaxID=2761396 RepID=A0A9W8H281_9FUNG|nr:hypothetical protein H4R18_005524 [Coemansia javaensis]
MVSPKRKYPRLLERSGSRRRCRRALLSRVFRIVVDSLVAADAGDGSGRAQGVSSIDQLRALVPLAAVCHSWRQAALPLLYQSVVCSISEAPAAAAAAAADGSAPGHVCRSNLGLVLGAGHEVFVRRLVLDLVGDVAPDVPVAALARAGFGDREWPGIGQLRVTHRHGSAPIVYGGESLARLNTYLLHMLPSLASVRYSSPDDRRHYHEFPLDGLLASTLSRLREVRLTTGLIPDMGSAAFLPRLTSLELRTPMLAEAAHLPMVFAETLERLHIGFSSADSIWDRFYVAGTDGSSSSKGGLAFPNLKTLALEYRPPSDRSLRATPAAKGCGLYDDCYDASSECSSVCIATAHELPPPPPPYEHGKCDYKASGAGDRLGGDDDDDDDGDTLLDSTSPTLPAFNNNSNNKTHEAAGTARPVLPRLRSLSVSRYPGSITHVLRHFAVERIPCISVRGVRTGWTSLRAATVAGLSSARVHISAGAEFRRDAHRFQGWVNQLFSVASQSLRSLDLDAPATVPVSLPDVIGATALGSLSLGFRVDLGAIPNLLSRLPCLRQLAMHVHPWSSWAFRNQGVLARGDHALLAAMPPLSRSLTSLVAYLGLVESDEDPSDAELELAWLLARVPSLRTFKTERPTRDAVCGHIDRIMACSAAAASAQHLASVEFSVWEY